MKECLLDVVRKGDIAALERLALENALGEVTEAEKAALCRTAAKAGQARMLRHLFEHNHLYSVEKDGEGRTLLHYAASSGDRETAAFCLDVLGYDPMKGDRQGKTPLELAAEAEDGGALALFREHLGFGLEDCYRNPVLRGFHPDPSVIRAGEEYYLVNSSFTYFPGLPVSRSRDLVHWELVGHAAEDLEKSGLQGLPGGYGYWAPDIARMRGRFYVTATLRRNTPPQRLQMLTWAARPSGPWAAPVFLPLDGIDPSLFEDDDGKMYMLVNPGAILTEIGPEGQLLSEPEMIYFGDAKIKPEGAHLLKKDGWYYLFLAEGGTGEGHMETVVRSRNLRGPYEACPFNPVLGRRETDAYIRRGGHGKPVELPDGRWAFVYLCGRRTSDRTVMGRETALDPMTWTAEGWPMVNGLKGPSCLQRCPLPTRGEGGANREWLTPRGDPAALADFGQGKITLRCGKDPSSLEGAGLLLRRQTEGRFTFRAALDLSGGQEGDLAGLCGYYDEKSFFLFGLERRGGGYRLTVREQTGEKSTVRDLGPWSGPGAELQVEGNGLDRTLTASDGLETRVLGLRTEYLCDEGAFGEKRFTGATLGLAAVGIGKAVFEDVREEMTEWTPEGRDE